MDGHATARMLTIGNKVQIEMIPLVLGERLKTFVRLYFLFPLLTNPSIHSSIILLRGGDDLSSRLSGA